MLVICFLKNSLLGGLGDRIVGLISVKVISKLLNQEFFILWNKENIKNYINYDKYEFKEAINENSDLKIFRGIDNHTMLKEYLITSNNFFPNKFNFFLLNQEISQYLFKNEKFKEFDYFTEILNEYKLLYTDILLPTTFLNEKINKLLKNKENIIGIQVRCGDIFMKTNQGERHNTGVLKNINNYLELIKEFCKKNYNNYNIFLTTDNLTIYKQVCSIFKNKQILYNSDCIQHIDRPCINPDISKIFMDNYILSQKTTMLFITKCSNYGRIAALSCIHDNIYDLDTTPIHKKDMLSKFKLVF